MAPQEPPPTIAIAMPSPPPVPTAETTSPLATAITTESTYPPVTPTTTTTDPPFPSTTAPTQFSSEPPPTNANPEPTTSIATQPTQPPPPTIPTIKTMQGPQPPEETTPMTTTTPYTTQYITTVSIVTITTVVPQTAVISGSTTTIYSTKYTTTRRPTIIPDPFQPLPPSASSSQNPLSHSTGLQTWQIILIIVAALVLVSACATVILIGWIRKRRRWRAGKEKAVELMPVGLEPWDHPGMGSPRSGRHGSGGDGGTRVTGGWHEYDKEGAYDVAGAAMARSYHDRYAANYTGRVGYLGHGHGFSEDHYSTGGPGSPHGHYRHSPYEEFESSHIRSGSGINDLRDGAAAESYQDDITQAAQQQFVYFPQPPPSPRSSALPPHRTRSSSMSQTSGNCRPSASSRRDSSRNRSIPKTSEDHIPTGVASAVSVADTADMGQDPQSGDKDGSGQVEKNSMFELHRKSPQALLSIRRQTRALAELNEELRDQDNALALAPSHTTGSEMQRNEGEWPLQ
ncbi:hypothetical protein BC939DRAFT_460700 [Gamsiella multidivaricata]|uniref:uncharacterized protein n=1 Tax=Gamsiella multidivaricata TaxID=101098 RepID=UPI0022201AB0|nr:uncharacterized protein BC939DRAFT_460700 [Gamsiella multidivaricata]KAG0356543.1 hypothetical protein BGZ54_000696 [Gamsiella multidivaricata]KAI7819257.1 hypothetical protein BC939DRAFT_460700 [Gamsiella multidivaricata]